MSSWLKGGGRGGRGGQAVADVQVGDACDMLAGDTYAIQAFHRRLREQLRPFAFVDLRACEQFNRKPGGSQHVLWRRGCQQHEVANG
jgi:hypothetical protein